MALSKEIRSKVRVLGELSFMPLYASSMIDLIEIRIDVQTLLECHGGFVAVHFVKLVFSDKSCIYKRDFTAFIHAPLNMY